MKFNKTNYDKYFYQFSSYAYLLKNLAGKDTKKEKKKYSGVALTQLALTLHYSKRIFYYQHYIHIQSLFSMLCCW